MDTATRTFQGEAGRDEFKREQVAEKVIQLLTSDIHLSPMLIDGDWGTGKTEFCHKLINKFKNSHPSYKILYVDAFQADHADNPLMTIFAAVLSLVPEDEKIHLLQKAMPVLRYGLAIVTKAGVNHLLRQDTDSILEGLDETLQDAANKAIDASVKALLKDHETANENLQALQKTLSDIATDTPIVIFVDELDRCRPDFAVQMLEVMKHTFDVNGVQFVLVTNTQQLKAAINHRYGPQVNAQRYLDKFLKFSFCLPEFVPGHMRSGDGLVLAATEHFSKLVYESTSLENTDLFNANHAVYQFANALVRINDLSLREVETFVRHLEIYHQLCQGLKSNTVYGYQLLRIVGIFAFCFAPGIANSIQKNKTNGADIANLLGLNEMPSEGYRWQETTEFALMLARASTTNKNQFLTTDPQTGADQKRRYFPGVIRAPEDIFDLTKEAIICLRLGSP